MSEKITLIEGKNIVSEDNEVVEIMNDFFTNVDTTLGILIFADTNFRGFRGFWPNSRKLISAKYFRSYDSRK